MNTLHSRLKQFSHSSNKTLTGCPRKFQIYRLQSPELPREENFHALFGKAVGAGVQAYLTTGNPTYAKFAAMLEWNGPYITDDTKARSSNKEAWFVMIALNGFIAHAPNLLKGWRVAIFNGKPAFSINSCLNSIYEKKVC